MLYHIAIHRPYPDKRALLLDSMRRFAAAARTQPGLREVHTLGDVDGNILVGFAIWESHDALQLARPTLRAAIRDDPHAEWEPQPPEVFLLEDV